MNYTAYRFTVMLLGCFLIARTAHALEFSMPLDCHYGQDCFIQNYVDDVASGHSDYRCGYLTYDGHTGTDFRLRDFAAMERGVKVLAAADGQVLRVRNDAPDTGLEAGRASMHGRECGNGVVIEHDDGFQTLYCHMRRGSIRVQVGARVAVGDPIGEVGYSGETEFPHVHFQVLRNGVVVDPFNAATQARCNGEHVSLWREDAALAYIPTVVLGSGFTDAPPQKDSIHAPLTPATSIARNASSLIFYATLMGLNAGDVLTLRITAPDGSVMVAPPTRIDHPRAISFNYAGKKLRGELATGTYVGSITLQRNGKPLTLDGTTTSITIR